MARARNVKPGLFKNEVLGVADPIFTLLFEGLWLLADRDGKLEDRPLRIKAEVFPYRSVEIEEALEWLQEQGFIERYAVGAKRYILVLEFKKHQNPHKNEAPSEIPDPHTEEIGTASENIGSTPADSLSSDSLNSDSLNTDSSGHPPAEGRPRKAKAAKSAAPTGAVWEAYRDAYRTRYGVDPVRNAQVNGQLAQLVGKLGAEEAPQVAAHYVGHRDAFYVKSGHSVGMLLRDAEKLRTEWATGRQIAVVPTDWRTEQRQRTQIAAPGVAVQDGPRKDAADFFIDVEARNVQSIG